MKLNEPAPQFPLKISQRTNRRYRCIRPRPLAPHTAFTVRSFDTRLSFFGKLNDSGSLEIHGYYHHVQPFCPRDARRVHEIHPSKTRDGQHRQDLGFALPPGRRFYVGPGESHDLSAE